MNILETCQEKYPSSRVHLMRTYKGKEWLCFVKREDELFAGTKFRKYFSLIPYLKKESIEEVAIIGGALSNNVLGASQLLIKNGITPTLFLRGEIPKEPKGNFLLLSTLVPSASIHWVKRSYWKKAEEIAMTYLLQQQKKGIKTFFLPEGASTEVCLPGAMTLGSDILLNEQELKTNFDHIFIDAGTGFSAIALILFFSSIKRFTPIHIVQMAGESIYFDAQLYKFRKVLETKQGKALITLPPYKLYRPSIAPAFGSITPVVKETVQKIATTEGFLVDPVYSAKLFYTARGLLEKNEFKGNILLIHSGISPSLQMKKGCDSFTPDCAPNP